PHHIKGHILSGERQGEKLRRRRTRARRAQRLPIVAVHLDVSSLEVRIEVIKGELAARYTEILHEQRRGAHRCREEGSEASAAARRRRLSGRRSPRSANGLKVAAERRESLVPKSHP